MRLAVSTAYWPILWPSPEPVTLTLFTGASQLLLPERAAQASDEKLRPLPEPVSANPPPVTTLRKGRVERTVTLNQVTREVSHRLYVDGGVFVPEGPTPTGAQEPSVWERM